MEQITVSEFQLLVGFLAILHLIHEMHQTTLKTTLKTTEKVCMRVLQNNVARPAQSSDTNVAAAAAGGASPPS